MKAVKLTLTSLLAFVLIDSIKATQLVLTPPSSSSTLSPSNVQASPRDLSLNAQKRSSEVFNAVNSVLRQWGSSLKHNGMSFIPVSIPANTLLYHGTYTTEPVKGTEWLAFEIEHAEFFARGRGGPPPGGRRPPNGPLKDPHEPSKEQDPSPSGIQEGYLHIYRTTHELTHLLYIDGLSAGKSTLGTLDSQDLILRSLKPGQVPPMSERERASDLCALSPTIQGIIRMEAGTELILCNFEKHLELDQVIKQSNKRVRDPHKPGGGMGSIEQFEYSRGVTKRYDGIGNGRIKPDFSKMVSAFWHVSNLSPDYKSTIGDPTLPRLIHSDPKELKKVKEAVISSLESSSESRQPSIEWQGVTDMVISRYADRLKFMELNATKVGKIQEEVDFLLGVYIDYSNANQTFDESVALEKCTNHYFKTIIPKTQADYLIRDSVSSVTSTICSTLFSIKRTLSLTSNSTSTSTTSVKAQITSLISFLKWTEWLKCRSCPYDKICYTAIWPFGSAESHFAPFCAGQDEIRGGREYWGDETI